LINEYGISDEPAIDFAERNKFHKELVLPGDLQNGSEVRRHGDIPYLPIETDNHWDCDWNAMLEEAKQFDRHYIPHRHHERHSGWSSLVLHGISSIHTEAPHVYGMTNENAPWRWTDISDFTPNIKKYFTENMPYDKFFRIRIMRLAPGGYIWPHKDSVAIEENHIGPTNIALNNPEGCHFYMDGHGILPWKQGTMISLNLYNVHCVYNHSDEYRYHMIVHGITNDDWNRLVYRSYLKHKIGITG